MGGLLDLKVGILRAWNWEKASNGQRNQTDFDTTTDTIPGSASSLLASVRFIGHARPALYWRSQNSPRQHNVGKDMRGSFMADMHRNGWSALVGGSIGILPSSCSDDSISFMLDLRSTV